MKPIGRYLRLTEDDPTADFQCLRNSTFMFNQGNPINPILCSIKSGLLQTPQVGFGGNLGKSR